MFESTFRCKIDLSIEIFVIFNFFFQQNMDKKFQLYIPILSKVLTNGQKKYQLIDVNKMKSLIDVLPEDKDIAQHILISKELLEQKKINSFVPIKVMLKGEKLDLVYKEIQQKTKRGFRDKTIDLVVELGSLPVIQISQLHE